MQVRQPSKANQVALSVRTHYLTLPTFWLFALAWLPSPRSLQPTSSRPSATCAVAKSSSVDGLTSPSTDGSLTVTSQVYCAP